MWTSIKKQKLLVVAGMALLLSGCAVNPVTGKSELSLISPEQEVAIGAKNYQPSQQAQGGRYYIDPEIQAYVSQVGRKLAAVSDRAGLPYEFVVLNNPVPNAWALPGGKIAINSGLLVHLEDEAQLAAVLAHEIVHAAARHGASQMSRGTLFNVGTQIAGIASQKAGYGSLGGVAAQLGSAAWMARYGRDDELESDAYGMVYMSRAGYDPYAAVELQETFVKLNSSRQQDFISGLFASHPPSQERVNRNREKAAALGQGGIRNRDLYQKKIAQLKKDQPAYEAEQKAIKALNDKQPDKALGYLDEAIRVQPRDGYAWELRGHAWEMKGDEDKAQQAFTTAISKNPDYFSHYLARGVLLYKNGKKTQARPDLQKSYDLLPTNTASYYLGEMAYSAGDSQKALGFYQQAAQSDTAMGKDARQKMVRLELAQSPHKYIPGQAYVGRDGYLRVVIQNQSGVEVTNVIVELVEMRSAFAIASQRQFRGPAALIAGQKWTLNTGIGPFADANDANRFRVQVISAKVR
ncbi:MAG: M48 family metalloprotease [Porticoccaceae bacterium]